MFKICYIYIKKSDPDFNNAVASKTDISKVEQEIDLPLVFAFLTSALCFQTNMVLSLWLRSMKPLNLMRFAPTSPQLIQHFILRISAARRQRLFPNSKPLPWGNCRELLVLQTNAVKFPPFHTGCTCWPVFVVIGAMWPVMTDEL